MSGPWLWALSNNTWSGGTYMPQESCRKSWTIDTKGLSFFILSFYHDFDTAIIFQLWYTLTLALWPLGTVNRSMQMAVLQTDTFCIVFDSLNYTWNDFTAC